MRYFLKVTLALVAVSQFFCINGFGHNSDTLKAQRYFIALPVAFYGEETSWGGGISGAYYFRCKNSRVSLVQGTALYTLKNQVSLWISPKIYTKDETAFYSGHIKANHFPNKFFGIGRNTADSLEENYTSEDFSVLLERQKILFENIMVGMQGNFSYYSTDDYKATGALATNIYGVKEKMRNGLGVVLTWENRENQFYPFIGEFYKVSLMVYSKIFGSELNFTQLKIDLRNYYNIFDEHVFALQFLANLSWGNVPFQQMPMLGGADVMRGYYQGRYRDKAMACVQGEYRFLIYKWLKGTFFGSVGDVAPYFDKLDIARSKVAYGGGLRIRVNPLRVNLRLDAAYSDRNEFAYYFTVTEAF
jgi:outer membrane protein assembly factor BamA